jgi:hypothetical protein
MAATLRQCPVDLPRCRSGSECDGGPKKQTRQPHPSREFNVADPKIDLTGAKIPKSDGEINEYAYKEALTSGQFNKARSVIFINGMRNSGEDHAKSALALSWVQMCTVVGVYNATVSGWRDFEQCIGDKNQFNGLFAPSAQATVAIGTLPGQRTSAEAARFALDRNHAQVELFDLLRKPENHQREIFAHSQGNLILSNALQAIAAVDGHGAIAGYTVHTFGSPAVNWPRGLAKHEHGFTWDPITFLAGFDMTWSISKVGMPSDSLNPITHSFLEYLKRDPAFVVNRFRWGGLGVTFNMDEDGLALALAAMGTNMRRVRGIFEHLDKKHNSDADDVAVRYINLVKDSRPIIAALKADAPLVQLLIRTLDEGWTSAGEQKAIDFLRAI